MARRFRPRRLAANTLIGRSGLWRLHGSRLFRLAGAILDEIDFQHFKRVNSCRAAETREDMYKFVQTSVIGNAPITYLEFGVYRGESLESWNTLNRHPDSRFVGFDSFEGLPEDWRPGQAAGHFSVAGRVPAVNDSRVSFVKGWFDDTVPAFFRDFKSSHRLIMHLDADLYASTLTVLSHAGPHLEPGTLLLFDEFYDREHEFKAFCDFLRMSRRRYQTLCQVDGFSKVCLELL